MEESLRTCPADSQTDYSAYQKLPGDRETSEEIQWHKLGYRVIEEASDGYLVARIAYFDQDGKEFDAKWSSDDIMCTYPDAPDSYGAYARDLMLLQTMCRYLNAGGSINEVNRLTHKFATKVPYVYHAKMPPVVDVKFDGDFEIVAQVKENEYLRIVEDGFYETLTGLQIIEHLMNQGSPDPDLDDESAGPGE